MGLCQNNRFVIYRYVYVWEERRGEEWNCARDPPCGSVSRKLDLIAGYGRRYPVSVSLAMRFAQPCTARAPLYGVLDTSSRGYLDAVYRAAKLWPPCRLARGAAKPCQQPRQTKERALPNNFKRIGNGIAQDGEITGRRNGAGVEILDNWIPSFVLFLVILVIQNGIGRA